MLSDPTPSTHPARTPPVQASDHTSRLGFRRAPRCSSLPQPTKIVVWLGTGHTHIPHTLVAFVDDLVVVCDRRTRARFTSTTYPSNPAWSPSRRSLAYRAGDFSTTLFIVNVATGVRGRTGVTGRPAARRSRSRPLTARQFHEQLRRLMLVRAVTELAAEVAEAHRLFSRTRAPDPGAAGTWIADHAGCGARGRVPRSPRALEGVRCFRWPCG
jgi:hypothetical protein